MLSKQFLQYVPNCAFTSVSGGEARPPAEPRWSVRLTSEFYTLNYKPVCCLFCMDLTPHSPTLCMPAQPNIFFIKFFISSSHYAYDLDCDIKDNNVKQNRKLYLILKPCLSFNQKSRVKVRIFSIWTIILCDIFRLTSLIWVKPNSKYKMLHVSLRLNHPRWNFTGVLWHIHPLLPLLLPPDDQITQDHWS